MSVCVSVFVDCGSVNHLVLSLNVEDGALYIIIIIILFS